ncbi:hypothetical protein BKA61DRAFT_613430 [Leptodontidium sp. MPI-SDFR-AT-0119]|nr:hypothetical protein BKA61DRAFT_613430 [Leptodontidium sp. MPI-SDFR-AT-0119]
MTRNSRLWILGSFMAAWRSLSLLMWCLLRTWGEARGGYGRRGLVSVGMAIHCSLLFWMLVMVMRLVAYMRMDILARRCSMVCLRGKGDVEVLSLC